ncbi:MAG: hypothetical protein JXQ27_14605 [Acidobacteria bacterium]|nr:hypothetical protein [Acidobacteriota bacterium]
MKILNIFAWCGLLVTTAGLAGTTDPSAMVYNIGLRDYVTFLEQAGLFRDAVRQGDFAKARQIRAEIIRRCPEITSGYEMGLLIGALEPDAELLASSLQDLTDKYLLYPDTYQTIADIPAKIANPDLHEQAREQTRVFFARRADFLQRKLALGLDREALHTELVYLYLATDDEGGVLRNLPALGMNGYGLILRLDQQERWRKNDAFHRLKSGLEKEWRHWDGSTEQKMYGLLLAATELRRLSAALVYAGLDNWHTHLREHLPPILNARNRLEYYEALAAAIHPIGDNHTFIRFPADVEAGFADCGLELQPTDGRVLVRSVQTKTLAGAVTAGDEIIAVAGLEPMEFITQHGQRYPFVRYMHHQPALYARHQCARRLLVGPRGSLVDVGLRRPDGSRYALRLCREHAPPDRTATVRHDDPPLRLTRPQDGILCFTIDTFATDNVYRIFLASLTGVDTAAVRGVIFDLRRNPGGHSGEGDAIFAHFIRQPTYNYLYDFVPVFIPHKVARGHGHIRQYTRGEAIRPAGEKQFDCPVVLLVSPDTTSAAEDFVFLFQYYHRGKVVGSGTSGATGEGHDVYLPGGGSLRINLNVNLYFFGRGILPDETVRISPADLAAGRDPHLERALAILAVPH